ncbi:hypothetical protein L9F63_004200 [Diploptera punctata]|uniref:Luciferin 4-monooxygenase n=1 Tax=Diploptera punctata TaxID=6984 RepID=A0AAD7ZHE8_DIPPU|nr:hypothetical protein L9F63_004200 [Diploptera punctata]
MDLEYILQGPEPIVPPLNVSLGKHLFYCIKGHGDKVALVDAVTGKTRTFSEILSRSISVAEGFKARGIKTGDVVSICSENSIDFILPVLAACYIGATCAPLNPAYTTRELLHALNISKPSIIFCSEKALETVERASQDTEFVKEIVVFGHPMSHKQTPFNRFLQFKSSGFEPVDVDPMETITAILCSSGTTGLPKGVMLTQHNMLTVVRLMKDPRFGDLRREDVVLGLLPMFHSYAFACQLITTVIGATVVVIKRFEEKVFLGSIQNYKITLLFLVPPLVIFLAKAPIVDDYDLTSLRSIRCGAAPLSEEVEILLYKRLGVGPVKQGYGMTETTLGVLITPPNRSKSGSSGVLVPDVKCKTTSVDHFLFLIPFFHQTRETIFFYVHSVTCGNLQSHISHNKQLMKSSFFHTVDLGYYCDEWIFLQLVNRLTELIKYNCFQKITTKLEAVLLAHPDIQDAGVIGVPDEVAGELPLAFVVKQPGSNVTKEEIIKYVAEQVSPQKRLHGGVEFVKSIPKTPSGKILRRELKLMLKSKL